MNDPREIGKRKLALIMIFIFAVPCFAISQYLNILKNGEILNIKNKYKVVNLNANCDWDLNNNYILCLKKDYLHFIRNHTHYEGLLAFDLFLEVKNHDMLKQTTELGRVSSYLDYLELLVSFFEINMSKSISRNKVDFIALGFTLFGRRKPLKEFRSQKSRIRQLEEKHKNIFEMNPLIKSKLKILTNRYLAIEEKLID